jgi:dihydrolipoamide dehydrogenase
MKKFDALVIGGGPGGYMSALRLARQGKTVVLFEKKKIGGSCLHVGCIPTKLLQSAAARFHMLSKEGKSWGIEADNIKINFKTLTERAQKTIGILEKGIQSQLAAAKVEIIRGEANVKAPDLILCQGEEYKGGLLVLALGSRPRYLSDFPVGETIVTSDELLTQPRLPKSLLIVGAGVIGLEFACLYAQLGTRVRVGDVLPNILPTMDEDAAQQLLNSLRRLGVEIELGLPRVQAKDEEMVLVAAGRAPNSDQAGLPALGLELQGAKIKTSGHLQTSLPGVYAIGDLTGNYPYAHSAYEHARLVAQHQERGGDSEVLDDTRIPHVVFTSPEIASVGLTEKEARAKYPNVTVHKNNFAANSKARILGEIQGWGKILADGDSGRILGVQLVGPEATDLIGEACLIVSKGVTLGELERVVHPHPTLNEIFSFH